LAAHATQRELIAAQRLACPQEDVMREPDTRERHGKVAARDGRRVGAEH
jgi:hypothetical protein